MNDEMKKLIENTDYEGIRQLLASNPGLANEGITIPYDNRSILTAHPLHRICDAVFAKKITDEEAIEIAKIFLRFGANINGSEVKENEDTPLLAAASLHSEHLGIFYIENGADIHFVGRHDGATALHWAAFCGRDKLVEKLIQQGASVDQRDKSYNSTPIAWALQPLLTGDKANKYHQLPCIKLLLRAGADTAMLNDKTIQYLTFLTMEDEELKLLMKM